MKTLINPSIEELENLLKAVSTQERVKFDTNFVNRGTLNILAGLNIVDSLERPTYVYGVLGREGLLVPIYMPQIAGDEEVSGRDGRKWASNIDDFTQALAFVTKFDVEPSHWRDRLYGGTLEARIKNRKLLVLPYGWEGQDGKVYVYEVYSGQQISKEPPVTQLFVSEKKYDVNGEEIGRSYLKATV